MIVLFKLYDRNELYNYRHFSRKCSYLQGSYKSSHTDNKSQYFVIYVQLTKEHLI